MLDLKNITISAGEKTLFALTDIVLKKGVIALVGRNGSGKSTFIKTLLGAHTDFTGSILLNEKNLAGMSMAEKSKLISVVYSRPQIFGNHSVMDVLALGRLPYLGIFSKLSEKDMEMIDRVAKSLKIESWYQKMFQNLSDGEKQMVMIGRALVQDTPLVLMDEPAAFLDIVNRYELSVLLKRIADESGKLILCSTHQLERLEADTDGVLLISDNQMKLIENRNEFLQIINNSFDLK